MNVSLDGVVADTDGDLGWSTPSDELFGWWSDRVASTGTALYGRRLWDDMSGHWLTADERPGVSAAHAEYARRWRAMPKVVFTSAAFAPTWNARVHTGDAVAEIARLRAEDGGRMDVAGATLAASALRAGLVDEIVVVTHPVVVGGGRAFLPSLPDRMTLDLRETRTFPRGVLLTRYAVTG
ncbi:dihydrofolate reductase family protein [Phycicoccus avicenniae]